MTGGYTHAYASWFANSSTKEPNDTLIDPPVYQPRAGIQLTRNSYVTGHLTHSFPFLCLPSKHPSIHSLFSRLSSSPNQPLQDTRLASPRVVDTYVYPSPLSGVLCWPLGGALTSSSSIPYADLNRSLLLSSQSHIPSPLQHPSSPRCHRGHIYICVSPLPVAVFYPQTLWRRFTHRFRVFSSGFKQTSKCLTLRSMIISSRLVSYLIIPLLRESYNPS